MINNPLAITRPKRVKPEKQLEQAVRAELTRLGCGSEKLHGDLFQSGLPDLLVQLSTGRLCMVELKQGSVKTVGELLNKLERRQRSFIPLWGRRSPIWILCGDKDRCYVMSAGRRDWDTLLEPKTLSEAVKEIIDGG